MVIDQSNYVRCMIFTWSEDDTLTAMTIFFRWRIANAVSLTSIYSSWFYMHFCVSSARCDFSMRKVIKFSFSSSNEVPSDNTLERERFDWNRVAQTDVPTSDRRIMSPDFFVLLTILSVFVLSRQHVAHLETPMIFLYFLFSNIMGCLNLVFDLNHISLLPRSDAYINSYRCIE